MDVKELVENIIIMFKLTYGKNITYYEGRYRHCIIDKDDNSNSIFEVAKSPIGKTYTIEDTQAVFHLEIEKIFDYGYSSLELYFKVGEIGERWKLRHS